MARGAASGAFLSIVQFPRRARLLDKPISTRAFGRGVRGGHGDRGGARGHRIVAKMDEKSDRLRAAGFAGWPLVEPLSRWNDSLHGSVGARRPGSRATFGAVCGPKRPRNGR